MTKQTLTIYSSPIMDWSLIGTLFYSIQLILLSLNLSLPILLGKNQRRLANKLIQLCNGKYQQGICYSAKVGQIITLFTFPLALDCPNKKQLLAGNEASYQPVMWTFVGVAKLTPATKSALQKIYGSEMGLIFKD